MNYIVTRNKSFFEKIGDYNYYDLEKIKLPDKIAVDTETTGLNVFDSHIFSVQIGTGKDNYLIDLQSYDTPLVKGKQIYLKEVFNLLKDKTLVFHNAAFDVKFFNYAGFFPLEIRDTYIASKILYNGSPPYITHDFGSVMERELNLKYDKSEQKNINKIQLSTKKSISYCFNDVDKLLLLEETLYLKLEDYGATETYLLNCNYVKPMVYMELCGLPISTTDWKKKIQEDIKNSNKYQLDIIHYIYDNLPQFRNNQLSLFSSEKTILPLLSSVKQMIPVFKAFDIDVINDEGKESIEESVINKSKHEFIDLWLKYKEAEHRVTTYGDRIIEKVRNGRIYTSYNPILDTCRISTRKGEINFLNFPSDKETRSCFKASKGFKIVGCDFSNQEARILADISLDDALLDSIINNIDVHSQLAKEVYPELKELTDKEIKQLHNDKRQEGKIANFTFAFGGNGYTLAKNLNTTEEKGKKIYEAYKNLHSKVFEWGDSVYEKAAEKGYIESAMGFKLKLPFFKEFKEGEKFINSKDKSFWEIYRKGKEEYKLKKEKEEKKEFYKIEDKDSYQLYIDNKEKISSFFKKKAEYFRLCLNNPIQSTAAHQTKLAMVKLFDYIYKNNHLTKARISVAPHDEIVMEVEESLAEHYKEVLSSIMVESANSFLRNNIIKMEADANIGNSWYEVK